MTPRSASAATVRETVSWRSPGALPQGAHAQGLRRRGEELEELLFGRGRSWLLRRRGCASDLKMSVVAIRDEPQREWIARLFSAVLDRQPNV